MARVNGDVSLCQADLRNATLRSRSLPKSQISRNQPHPHPNLRVLRASRGRRVAAAANYGPNRADPQAKEQRNHDQLRRVQLRSDYPANAVDKSLLKQPPGSTIDVKEADNCFDYPRNLYERYEVKERIGSGGFGQVYRAVSAETGISYACKSIPKSMRDTAGQVTPHHLLRVRSEVDSMTQLGASLDAASLKEVFEDEHYIHLIMELCTGGAVVEDGQLRHSNYSEDEVADIMRSVLRFLSQCAAKGVVYRDVKPSNFLFTDKSSSRRIKATDFGLAVPHSYQNDPPLMSITGTTLYMAPELVQRAYGSQADVYSAGVMCFALLTRRYPYWPSGRIAALPSNKEIFEKIVNETIDFSSLSGKLSEDAVDFLRKLLTKDPNMRPTAAEALDHAWLRKEGPPSVGEEQVVGSHGAEPIPPAADGTIVQRLQRFGVSGPFRKMTLSMVVEELMREMDGSWKEVMQDSSSASPELLAYVQSAPFDESGKLSLMDVVRKLSEDSTYDLSRAEAAQLTSHMDVSNDGTVDRYELISSLLIDWDEMIHQRPEQWEGAMRKVFVRLDRDGDGYIGAQDIAETLLSTKAATDSPEAYKRARDLLRDADLDNNGVVTWAEYYEAMSLGGRVDMMPPLHFFDSRQSTAE